MAARWRIELAASKFGLDNLAGSPLFEVEKIPTRPVEVSVLSFGINKHLRSGLRRVHAEQDIRVLALHGSADNTI